jgi:hypothetical protein
MSVQQPFFPAFGTGVVITTSASATANNNVPADAKQLCLTATGNACYIRLTIGGDTTAATTADFLVPVSTPRTISKGPEQTRISVISPGGAGTLHFIGGEGATAM